ncbi:MAG: DJ-1/PfpI family protein [Eubacteriales bacterium]|nr:DJ-1/PfpI family protein [Eubacteriales bacterium]MDD4389985.1 DJ-1/PfpI family protein [Eubacteriales bacterium]
MVYVHLSQGFEEIEALTVVDLLRRVNIDVKLVAVSPTCSDDSYKVKGAHDIVVYADLLFDEADYDACDMIVLPGGMPGTTNLLSHRGLKEKLELFYNQKKPIAAICAAPMILGKSGMLKGRTAVCYPGMEGYLEGATVGKEDVVIDDFIITSKGPGTAMKFALEIIRFLLGDEAASELKKELVNN